MLASEYGWTRDYILEMPIDQPPQLVHAILVRRGVKVFRKAYQKDPNAESLADRMRAILDTETKEE